MIREVSIQNYKSISELTLDLGRVNVLIGANGCGKSNILEAIILGNAWAADKLDNEFLANRGIRIGDPRLLRCGFDKANLNQPIRFAYSGDENRRFDVKLDHHEENPYGGWEAHPVPALLRQLASATSELDSNGIPDRTYKSVPLTDEWQELRAFDRGQPDHTVSIHVHGTHAAEFQEGLEFVLSDVWRTLGTFLTYAPQISTLRQLQLDSHIEPLGLHGEGLFRLLQVLEKEGQLGEVNDAIGAIDWFDGLELVGNGGMLGRQIRIVDHFLDPAFPDLDHRSANEGFLFFLFYIALLISRHTPRFFAVENVDESLNPKLCVQLVQTITRLSEKHRKQVILTTHNPAVLDGLDLTDDEQRLFVIYRNADGHTRARRVQPADHGERSVRLSEAFIRGYLGGLPTNF